MGVRQEAKGKTDARSTGCSDARCAELDRVMLTVKLCPRQPSAMRWGWGGGGLDGVGREGKSAGWLVMTNAKLSAGGRARGREETCAR